MQQLQEITDEQALAEGVWDRRDMADPRKRSMAQFVAVEGACEGVTARDAFTALWNSIAGPGGWDANPYVAAISFRVEHRNIHAREAA